MILQKMVRRTSTEVGEQLVVAPLEWLYLWFNGRKDDPTVVSRRPWGLTLISCRLNFLFFQNLKSFTSLQTGGPVNEAAMAVVEAVVAEVATTVAVDVAAVADTVAVDVAAVEAAVADTVAVAAVEAAAVDTVAVAAVEAAAVDTVAVAAVGAAVAVEAAVADTVVVATVTVDPDQAIATQINLQKDTEARQEANPTNLPRIPERGSVTAKQTAATNHRKVASKAAKSVASTERQLCHSSSSAVFGGEKIP
jgi:hypothetical protein